MYRRQFNDLLEWLGSTNEKRKPLIIRGARQVGKSTLVELFCKQQGLAMTMVNLEKTPSLLPAFQRKNVKDIIEEISFLDDAKLDQKNPLIFLDEIQAMPPALSCLRYFYEEASIPVIAAGSLLDFTLSDDAYSMPVGRVDYLNMGPMTFLEFLVATGEDKIASYLEKFTLGQNLLDSVHEKLLELMRIYLFTGGMPEAVATYAQTRDYKRVSKVHLSILDTYKEDFAKYGGKRDKNRMRAVFEYCGRNVGKKIKYSNIDVGVSGRIIREDIELLTRAKVVHKVCHSSANGVPVQAEEDQDKFKLLFLDGGLSLAMSGLSYKHVKSSSLNSLIDEGSIAEQFAGQHLLTLMYDRANRSLNYWMREKKSANAEVDYVFSVGSSIVPIEIKAGASGSLKSLHQFMHEKKLKLAVRFWSGSPQRDELCVTLSTGEKVAYTLLSFPLYMAEILEKLLESIDFMG